MALTLTKPAVDVFASTDGGGTPRKPKLGEARTWGTEIETYLEGISTASVRWGEQTDNPYAGPYEFWRVGIGGIGYYDRQVLGNNSFRSDAGTVQIQAPFLYGDLDNATAMTTSALSNRPGAILGLTAPAQVGAYNETGATAHLAQADLPPVMLRTSGTYTSTTFTPASPITETETVKIKVGMYCRTDTAPSHQGQITEIAYNGSDQVTAITVAGWFKTGDSVGSTPSNSAALLFNPMDKVWGRLNTVFLSALPAVANMTNGSTIVAVTNRTLRDYLACGSAGHRISGPGIPANARITSIDPNSNNVFIWPAATATATGVDVVISLGLLYGTGHGEELDIFNAGPDFEPVRVKQTVSWTSGDYFISVPDISQWRPGLVVRGVPAAWNYANTVTQLDFVNSKVRLKYPANATGSGDVRAFNMLDEAGVGYDSNSVRNRGQTSYLSRGNWHYGYMSHGAKLACFYHRPGVDAAAPEWTVAVDLRSVPTNGPSKGILGHIDDSGTERVVISPDGTAFNGVALDSGAWTAYTPVCNAVSGAFTSATPTGRYQKRGRTVTFVATAVITTNGTAAGGLILSLPLAAQGVTVFFAANVTDTITLVGRVLAAGATAIYIQTSGGGHPGADGKTIVVSGTYETAS